MDPGEAMCCPQIERYGSAMALLTVPRSFAAALAAARQSPKSAGAVRRKQLNTRICQVTSLLMRNLHTKK